MSEDYNSRSARFGRMSPVDMMDKVVELEAELCKARSFTSANHAAQDVLGIMCTVAEKNEYFESVSDEFIAEVYGTVGRTYDLEVKNARVGQACPLEAVVAELRKELDIALRSARQWEQECQMAERNNGDRKAEVLELREKLKAANKRAGDAAETLGWNRVATNLAGAEVVRLRAVVDSLTHHVRELEMIRSNLLPEELDRP